MEDEEYQCLFADRLENLPKVHVEVENEPYSDTEVYLDEDQNVEASVCSARRMQNPPLSDIGNQLVAALFDSDSVTQENNNKTYCANQDDSWQLPKLKAPQKGEPISNSLASLINTAFTV